MKTRNAKVLCTLLICFASTLSIFAQQTEVIHNSTSTNAHMELKETTNNDFARLFYTNNSSTDRWSVAGRLGASSLAHQFGIFYNGASRYFYDETNKRTFLHQNLELNSDPSSTNLDIDFDMKDGTGANATSFGNINWIDEVGGQFGRIRAFSNQGGSAIPEYLSLSGGMLSGAGKNFMTLYNDYTLFADNEVSGCAGCGAGGRVNIVDNSTGTDQQLRVIESNATDYARIGFYNSGSSDRWNIAGRPGAADKALALTFNGDQALYLRGGVGRIGVNDSAPSSNFHIKQVGNGEEGLAIENDTDTDTWSWEIGNNDLSIYFNAVYKGFWDDGDGAYTEASDLRLKNNVNELPKGVLEKLMKVKATDYYYNDNAESSEKSIGFIAQDIQKLFPSVVAEFDDGSGMLGVKYSKVAVLAVKAIQEQQEIINQKDVEIKDLKAQMESVLARLDALEK